MSDLANITRLDRLRLGVTSVTFLDGIERLRRLQLTTCAPIPDLQWTAGMDSLDFFSFVETKVEDGDLSRCRQ